MSCRGKQLIYNDYFVQKEVHKQQLECRLIKRNINNLNEKNIKNLLVIKSHQSDVNNHIKDSFDSFSSVFGEVKNEITDYILKKKKCENEKSSTSGPNDPHLPSTSTTPEFNYLRRYMGKISWSTMKIHPGFSIINENILKSEKYGWKTAFSNQLLTKGEYNIEIKLLNYGRGQLGSIGILKPQKYYSMFGNNFSNPIHEVGLCLDLSSGDKCWGNNKKAKYLKPGPRKGDVIRISVNFLKKEISFDLNKTKLGPAFSGNKVTPPLVLGVSSFMNDQKFELSNANKNSLMVE